MMFKPAVIFCLLLSLSCNNNATSSYSKVKTTPNALVNSIGKNPYAAIYTIPLPYGYKRIKADSNSFANWLRKVLLKEKKTVYLFDGTEKINQQAQFAVLNIAVGNKNLQQCADAVMRLRSEYLFTEKRYAEIIFYDNEQGIYKFTEPYTKENFTNFMLKVFGMCGSASLSKQLKTVPSFLDIQPGDVLIRGGFPGHAVIVMDVAENEKGKKVYMLAQSYMPAQDIHLLVNPVREDLSPWYEVNGEHKIITPEYLFYSSELKRW